MCIRVAFRESFVRSLVHAALDEACVRRDRVDISAPGYPHPLVLQQKSGKVDPGSSGHIELQFSTNGTHFESFSGCLQNLESQQSCFGVSWAVEMMSWSKKWQETSEVSDNQLKAALSS